MYELSQADAFEKKTVRVIMILLPLPVDTIHYFICSSSRVLWEFKIFHGIFFQLVCSPFVFCSTVLLLSGQRIYFYYFYFWGFIDFLCVCALVQCQFLWMFCECFKKVFSGCSFLDVIEQLYHLHIFQLLSLFYFWFSWSEC